MPVTRSDIGSAAARLATALGFAGCVATVVVLLGTRDLESYEHAFFSLDRGTAVDTVDVLGQPVYTLALGLGVRLPLHGSLAASPAARLAPFLPAPITYGLLLTLAIAAAVLIVRHALEPLCGAGVSWIAAAILFYSVPLVSYTISADWPETAVTYCTVVVCVFAPHALLALLGPTADGARRRLAQLAVAAVLWAAVALSHPGYWPLVALVLGSALAVVLCRTDHPARTRLAVVLALAPAALAAVALQAPDILRELAAAGNPADVARLVDPTPGGVVEANLFPLTAAHARLPFGFLLLALVSLVVALTSTPGPRRRLIVVSAVASAAMSVATSVAPGSAAYAPSNTWTLRDAAGAFAVLAAACAAGARRKPGVAHRVPAAALAALALAALQGPAYATSLVRTELAVAGEPWTHDMAPPDARISRRGLRPDRVPPGGRLVLWSGVRDRMRNRKRASTDFADAGYVLVTAWTKQRTMRGVVEPNPYLFNQEIDFSREILCDDHAVRFLRLRYLLRPSEVDTCQPWEPVPGMLVDGWLEVDTATHADDRVRAVPLARLTDAVIRSPALSAGSALLPFLNALPGTSVAVTANEIVVDLDDPAVAGGHALVLPVAYDAAWRASSGEVRNTGGLLALVGIDQHRVTARFAPDAAAVLRAGAFTMAQILGALGLLGLVAVGRPREAGTAPVSRRGGWAAAARSGLGAMVRQRRNWLFLGVGAAAVQRLDGQALLLPVTALGVVYLARRPLVRQWGVAAFVAGALLSVAAGGSRAAGAPHDPLFWCIVAVGALGVSAGVGRRQTLAVAACALAGASIAIATLLPFVPGFESRFPRPDVDVIQASLAALAGQMGSPATVLLVVLLLQPFVVDRARWTDVGRADAIVLGTLAAVLILSMSGTVPEAGLGGRALAALGLLLGFAEAWARRRR